MKKTRSTLLATLALALAVTFMSSCSQETEQPQLDEISEETKAKFTDLGFDVSDIQLVSNRNPLTGETSRDYLLEGDIHIPTSQMEEMLESDIFHVGAMGEQYRTSNLVSNNQTISVIGYTGSGYALSNRMRTGLQWAINNYNNINTGLKFTLSFAASTSADIVVYNGGGSSAGGSAGFPSGGNPYKWVQILGGLANYSNNVNEHVIGHEIGHCLGLRHTDYFNRSYSCGSGGNEGSAGVGAIHIPGTPTGVDPNSLMLACFNSGVDGEFSNDDVDALEYLY